jgi:hypothetical protein
MLLITTFSDQRLFSEEALQKHAETLEPDHAFLWIFFRIAYAVEKLSPTNLGYDSFQ